MERPHAGKTPAHGSGDLSPHAYQRASEDKKQMKSIVIRGKRLAGILAVALVLILGMGTTAIPVHAASGTVYTCNINRTYTNPVSGEIEDSGGAANYDLGQSMVEKVVYPTGILEVTDAGEYYLTIRMGMVDYVSGNSFTVQPTGASEWSTPAVGETGSGSDGNGTTKDVCIQLPSEDCIVRVSMHVDPMGRDVIFFFYPSDYAEGNNTDMNATMVTQAPQTAEDAQGGQTAEGGQATQDGQAARDGQTAPDGTTAQDIQNADAQASQDGQNTGEAAPDTADVPEETQESAGAAGTGTEDAGTNGASGAGTQATDSAGTTAQVGSAQTKKAATPTKAASAAKTEVPKSTVKQAPATGMTGTASAAKGLSLSTQKADTAKADAKKAANSAGTASGSEGKSLMTAALVTGSGLILIAAVAGIIFVFRKNWKRWGGEKNDD